MIAELEEIKRILWEEWDPIGVNAFAPRDEYDGYAFEVFVMFRSGKVEADFVDYLRRAALENMGLDDPGNVESVARKIVALGAHDK